MTAERSADNSTQSLNEESHDPDVHLALGLTDEEFETIKDILGREPNHLELAMYSVMWSEHCSYKSSRAHLGRLPTTAPWVMVGPGENAGVIDVGDGVAVAMRIESHNHPSAIEPYQGAATGAGGILRDIFTMGARPIALMDPLRFGPLDDPRSKWIAEGVVSGISGYGNSVGVPTVGGEVVFDSTYQDNPLVNVFCLGILPHERLVLGQATGVGNLAVLLGNSTGRDGIGGVSVLASAGFGDAEEDEAKRPSVQVGDPYEEKRLIEACLALLDENYVVGIQDLGGAGLACATSETASRGGVGMDVYVGAIPRREKHMEPFEVMTSESQERMLAIVEPHHLDAVLDICRKWEVQASVIGTVTDGGDGDNNGALRLLDTDSPDDQFVAAELGNIPASSLHEDAPLYHRPLKAPDDLAQRRAASPNSRASADPAAELLDMLMDTSWVSSQYDHQLFLNTVVGPTGNAAVLRLKHPVTGADTKRALAMSCDGNHRWCSVDPRVGTSAIVAESLMNIATTGAVPKALVNCLNFGNPEHPEVMWQLSDAIDGMAEACTAFDIPVVGGNVSLYNESQGSNIDPTPVVTVVGVIDDLNVVPPPRGFAEKGRILLLGETVRELAGSRWAFNAGERGGTLPPVDFDATLATAGFVRELVINQRVQGVSDVAEGGIGVALAEMAITSGIGFSIARINDHIDLFSESVGRAIVCVHPEEAQGVIADAEALGVPVMQLGVAMGNALKVKGLVDVSLADAADAFSQRIPLALGAGTSQG